MTRQDVESDLEERFLNKYVRYTAITDVEFHGKVDSIAFYNELVIFRIGDENYKCDLEWFTENTILL